MRKKTETMPLSSENGVMCGGSCAPNKNREVIRNIIQPVALVSGYLLFVSFYFYYLSDHHILISINDATSLTLKGKLFQDAIPFVFGLYMVLLGAKFQKKTPQELGLLIRHPVFFGILAAVYTGMFLLSGEFSTRGVYAFFYYLMVVSFTEEFIFRAYLFTSLEKTIGMNKAIVVSGALWGAAHSVINIAVYSQGILYAVLPTLGGGILGSFVFVLLFKKSRTIYIPILVHAVLGYLGYVFIK